MVKTYNVSSKEEAKAIIVKLIMAKVKKIAGDKKIRINVQGDADE